MAKILIVEDDLYMSQMISDYLTHERHMVDTSSNGRDGLERLIVVTYDMAIVDWALPEMTGVEICRKFRESGGRTPILMLTGKQQMSEKEQGFDSGADDYLTKPFNIKELAARVKALLRRPASYVSPNISINGLVLNPDTHKLHKDTQEVHLVPREFALLEFLMRHPEQVFSADALIDRVWKSETDATVEAIRTCIKRLRKKIDADETNSMIETIYGVGYRLKRISSATD